MWKVNPAAATVTLLAGIGLAGYDGDDKAATTARLNFPSGVAVDGAGRVYIADTGNGRIRFIDADGFIRTAISGLRDPGQITFDKAGSLLIGEYTGRRVLRWTPGGEVEILAGNSAIEANGDGGPLATASYAGYLSQTNAGIFPEPRPAARSVLPRGQGLVAAGGDGTLYFSDVCVQPPPRNFSNELQTPCLRQIDPAGNVTRRFQFTFDAIHADVAGNLYGFLFGQVARYEGTSTTALPAFFQANGPITQDASGVFYYSTAAGQVFRLPADVQPNSQGVLVAGRGNAAYSGAGGPATQAGIPGIQSLAVDRQGNLYISHVDFVPVGTMVGAASLVSKVSPDGLFTLISGDFAPADQPCKIAIDARDQLVAGCNSPSAGATVYRFVNGRRQVVAGGLGLPETNYQPADGSAASALKLATIGDMKAGPDGSLYLADVPARKIYRIRLD